MDNVHENHRERVRNKFKDHGFDTWYDHEVLEMMLFYVIPRSDTNPVAHALIKEFGTLAQVLDADIPNLMKVKGVGENTAIFLSSLGKLQNVYTKSKWQSNKVMLGSSTATGLFAVDYIGNEKDEVFAVICLDSKNFIKKKAIIARGMVDKVPVYIRKIADEAMMVNAKNIVICHNHPSGDPTPSAEDVKMTDEIVSSLRPFGIEVVDHIVVGGKSFISMADTRLLKN